MAEEVKKSDISEKDIFSYVIEGAKLAKKEIDEYNKALQGIAEINKAILNKPTKLGDPKQIKDTEKAINAVNSAFVQYIKNETELNKVEAQSIRAKEQLKKAIEAETKATEKATLAKKKESDAYNKLSKDTRDLKNESKRLGAELLALENAGKRNTLEWSKTQKEYKQTTAQALKLDTQLKKLDSSVGDNQRNVGNYRSIFNGLKSGLAQLGLAFGVFEGVRFLAGTEVRLQSLQLALKNVLGTTEQYNKSFEFLTNLSKDYGQDLLVLTDTYKSFIASSNASGLALEERNKIYQSVIKAGSSLALSNEQIEGSLLAVSQMFSKGKVSAEELRGQLGERLPGAFGIMAKSMGVTEQQLDKMLQNGEVLAKDVLPKFGEELEKTFGANAKKNLETIGGAWNVLKTNITLYVNEANEGGRVTKAIAGAIGFLANNIGTIISVLGKLITCFITFKGVMLALKLQDQFTNWKNLRGAIAQTSVATDEAGKSAKGFGNALKGIGWAVAIQLAFEFGKEIYNIASGYKQAEFYQNKFNEGLSKGSEFSKKVNDTLSETNKKRMQELELLRSKDKISEKEFQMQKKLLIQKQSESVDKVVKDLKAKYNAEKVRHDGLERLVKKEGQYTETGQKAIIMLGASKKALGAYKQGIKDLTETKTQLTDADIQNTIEVNNNNKALKTHKQTISEVEKEYKKWLETRTKLSRENNQMTGINGDEIGRLEDENQQRRRNIADIGVLQAELTGDLNKIDEARINQIKENLAVDLKNYELNAVERKKIELQAELDIQRIQRESYVRRFKTVKEFVDLSTEYFIKRSEERIDQIDKEIEASEKQADVLRELAKNGNITAQQSLAEQDRITRESNEKKVREQKRIERLKLAQTAFDVYGKKVESGDKNPLIGTIRDIELLRAFINALPAFEKGTDNAPKGLAITQEKGREAIFDENWNLKSLGSDSGAQLTHLEKGDKVLKHSDTVERLKMSTSHALKNTNGAIAGNSFDIKPLLDKMDAVERAIKNQPVPFTELGQHTRDVFHLIEGYVKNGKTVRNNQFIKKP